MNKNTKSRHPYQKSIVLMVIILLAIYVFVPQLKSFQSSLRTVQHADKVYLLLAVIFISASYFVASLSFYLVTYLKVKYWPTFLVQVANGFTNRILPAGIGSIATNVLYLMKLSKSAIKAGYVAALNNIVGFVAHIILLLLLLIYSKQSVDGLVHIKTNTQLGWFIAILIMSLLLLALFFWRSLKRFTIKGYSYLIVVIKASFKKPLRIFGGLLAAMLVTILYALCLQAVNLALNVHLTILQVFLVLTVSVLATIITPTPGGLGGVEAGMVASLIYFGVEAGPALSVTLVYRLVTYWLPIIPGAFALRAANSKGYLARPKL